VLQQLHDRYLRGETTDERMATRGERVPEFAARARRLLLMGKRGVMTWDFETEPKFRSALPYTETTSGLTGHTIALMRA